MTILGRLILLCLIGVCFFPSIATAQVDTRCFTIDDCRAARNGDSSGFFQSRETEQACQGKTDARGVDVGFCNAQTQVNTSISIGGVRVFAHIGDYIQIIFRFGMGAVVLLSIVMIIVAGVQWSASAGNAALITAAQTRMKKAIIGLLIGVGCVVFLSQINPYLVNFRLPQLWMINQILLSSEHCNDNVGQSVSESEDSAQIKAEDALCGKVYTVARGGGKQCTGMKCPNDAETCVPLLDGKRVCKPGMLSGKVTATNSFLASDLSGNIIDNDLKLIAMCKNGRLEEIDEIDVPLENKQTPKDQDQTYHFTYNAHIEKACKTLGNGLVGFFLGAEINDEGTGIGSAGSTLTTGIDDWHAIGKQYQTSDQTTSHRCSTNLSIQAYALLNGGATLDCSDEDVAAQYCSCAAISKPDTIQRLIQRSEFTRHLITLEELKKGFSCDIHITRLAFPAIDKFDPIEDDTDCFEYQ